MKKRILCRALIGAPIGLAISTAITIFSSLIYGDGNYYPVVPVLNRALIKVSGKVRSYDTICTMSIRRVVFISTIFQIC